MSGLFGGGNDQPNIVIPPAETPRAFQTVIPQKSYKDLAESMNRTEAEYNRLLDTRYDMTGTGAELGAKQRGIEMQEAASYASSLPKADSPDTSFRGTPREFDIKSKGNTFETNFCKKLNLYHDCQTTQYIKYTDFFQYHMFCYFENF